MRRSSRFYAPNGLTFAEESARADRQRAADQEVRDAAAELVWGQCPVCGEKVRHRAAGAPEVCILCSVATAPAGQDYRRVS